jgi:hypothetical protein
MAEFSLVVVAMVLFRVAIPLGLGALVLTWVLRRHRKQLLEDIQSTLSGGGRPGVP